MGDLIKKIEMKISEFDREVSAIEMTPKFHLALMKEILACDKELMHGVRDLFGIPIIFVHGEDGYFRLLNNKQFKLRSQYNNILQAYAKKYKNLYNCINNAYKFDNLESLNNSIIIDLSSLTKRLDEIEKQIEVFY